MFKRHALQVKMVKNENQNEETDPELVEELFTMKVTIIGDVVKNALTTAGKVALAYVVVDTLRQVAIEKAKK